MPSIPEEADEAAKKSKRKFEADNPIEQHDKEDSDAETVLSDEMRFSLDNLVSILDSEFEDSENELSEKKRNESVISFYSSLNASSDDDDDDNDSGYSTSSGQDEKIE